MKRFGFVVIETALAVLAVLFAAGLLFYFRAPIGAQIKQLRGQDKVATTPTPTLTPLITPLPTSTFHPHQATPPLSIIDITPTPRSTKGGPLPSSGPEDGVVIIFGIASLATGSWYYFSRKTSKIQRIPLDVL